MPNNALMQFHADNRWTPATAETATVPRFATSQWITIVTLFFMGEERELLEIENTYNRI